MAGLISRLFRLVQGRPERPLQPRLEPPRAAGDTRPAPEPEPAISPVRLDAALRRLREEIPAAGEGQQPAPGDAPPEPPESRLR